MAAARRTAGPARCVNYFCQCVMALFGESVNTHIKLLCATNVCNNKVEEEGLSHTSRGERQEGSLKVCEDTFLKVAELYCRTQTCGGGVRIIAEHCGPVNATPAYLSGSAV